MSATIKGAAAELGTERIRKLLVQYAVPAVIAMTAASLYNMVDSIFIGHGVGPLAISGLALTFPLMNLAAAFGSLVGVGAATLVSMRLGQRDYETAQRVLGNVLVLNLIIGISFGLVTLAFLAAVLYLTFGANRTEQEGYTVQTERPAREEVAPERVLVNINTATAEELETVTGIGPVLAQAILDYRAEHGDFQTLDELLEVRGIGSAKLDAMRDEITTGGDAP